MQNRPKVDRVRGWDSQYCWETLDPKPQTLSQEPLILNPDTQISIGHQERALGI